MLRSVYRAALSLAAPGGGGTGRTFPPPNTNFLELREWEPIVKKFQNVKFSQIFIIKIFWKSFKINFQNLSKL